MLVLLLIVVVVVVVVAVVVAAVVEAIAVVVVIVVVGLRTHFVFRSSMKPEGRTGEKRSKTRPERMRVEKKLKRKNGKAMEQESEA